MLDKPFTFSDGLTLPVGTRFGFPIKAIQNDPELEFDGFRFARMNSEADRADTGTTKWGASTMSATNLA